MDQQGSGRSRSAADPRGQAPPPWPGSPDDSGHGTPSGAQPVLGARTEPQRRLGYGSGAQPVLQPVTGARPVTGAQPVTRAQPVTGTQPAAGGLSSLGRTPARGFPPGREPVKDGPWPPVADPLTGGTGGFAPVDATDPNARFDWQTPPAQTTQATPVQDMTVHATTAQATTVQATTVREMTAQDATAQVPAVPAPASTTGAQLPPGGRRGAKAKARRGWRSRPMVLAAAAIVVVAAAGYGGYKYLYEARVNAPVPSTLRLPTSAPGSPDFDKALGKWQHISSRTTDPDALTIEALYPPQFEYAGSTYIRTAASVTKNCTDVVYGANLQAALQSGHCTQVARASYISGNEQMMGTVGVVNLSTTAAATKAGQTTGQQEIIAPLAAQKGPTSKLGNGTGVVQAEIKGHYLILMWAEFTNLKTPATSAAKAELEQFATNLVIGTANINLSTRMLTGKA